VATIYTPRKGGPHTIYYPILFHIIYRNRRRMTRPAKVSSSSQLSAFLSEMRLPIQCNVSIDNARTHRSDASNRQLHNGTTRLEDDEEDKSPLSAAVPRTRKPRRWTENVMAVVSQPQPIRSPLPLPQPSRWDSSSSATKQSPASIPPSHLHIPQRLPSVEDLTCLRSTT
jgi:hypothetical protein